jgi:hypothetical protein
MQAMPLAHRDGPAVDDEVAARGLSVGEPVAKPVEEQDEPAGQGVEAPREALGGRRPRQIARRALRMFRSAAASTSRSMGGRHAQKPGGFSGLPSSAMAMPVSPYTVVPLV